MNLNLRVREDRGASAAEFGLLIAGIAAVITAAVFLLGSQVSGLFADTCDEVGQAVVMSAGSCP